jgi:hypothetical protein
LKSADSDLYMIFVIMLTDTIPDMARSGVSMRYFSPRYRKKGQKKRISTLWGGGGDFLARGSWRIFLPAGPLLIFGQIWPYPRQNPM